MLLLLVAPHAARLPVSETCANLQIRGPFSSHFFMVPTLQLQQLHAAGLQIQRWTVRESSAFATCYPAQ